MFGMWSDFSQESKLDERDADAVSSALNVYIGDVCEKSSPLIVDLSKPSENKAFIEHENEEPMTEVRSRKLTKKGRSYQVENLVKLFKSQETKQEFSEAQGSVEWNLRYM